MIYYHVAHINRANSNLWCNIRPAVDDPPSVDISGLLCVKFSMYNVKTWWNAIKGNLQ